MTHTRAAFMFAAMILLSSALAAAQNALPRPDPAFQGKIEQTYKKLHRQDIQMELF